MKWHHIQFYLCASLLLTACGGSGAGDGPTPTYSISGSIGGLTESGLTLTNNGSASLSVPANATTFRFAGTLASGAAYSVAVAKQPDNPPLYCAVSDGSGTVGQANVTGVQVTCVRYQVLGGGVANLVGSGLSLSVNGGAPLAISQSGPFTFPTQLPQGTSYSVKIVQQPTNPSQACVLVNGSGTVPTSNLSSIAVYCPRPIGRFAYVVNSGVSLYAIDASTGTLTAVGAPLAIPAASVALGPNALYVGYDYSKCVKDCGWRHPFDGSSRRATDKAQIEYFGFIDVYARDAETGVLSPSAVQAYALQSVGQFPVLNVAPSGLFGYVTAAGEGIVTVSLDPQSGALTLVPPILPPSNMSPLVISASGTFAANVTDQGLTTYQLNAQTGALNPLTPIKSSGSYGAAAIEPTGRFLYASAPNEIAAFAIDSSGQLRRFQGALCRPARTGPRRTCISRPPGHICTRCYGTRLTRIAKSTSTRSTPAPACSLRPRHLRLRRAEATRRSWLSIRAGPMSTLITVRHGSETGSTKCSATASMRVPVRWFPCRAIPSRRM